MRKLLLALIVVISACAPKTVPVPVVTTPKFPEFTQPPVPPAFANSPVANTLSRGWAFFQTGDLKTAEREFAAALTAAPAFYPAETSLGHLELARKDAKAALPHFDRALESQQNDVPALLGRGQALMTLNREADALTTFEAALAADPSLTDIRRRVEVLKFRVVEQNIARARQLARQGQADEALQAYAAAIASSPDSPFLYREVAAIERQRGNADAALADFRKAIALDPSDARSLAQIGEILESQNDLEGAAKAYTDALALEPNADVEKRLGDLNERVALARLPAEYRAIDEAPQINRGDLAALIGIRLGPLLQTNRRDAVLVTDIRNHWASTWIMTTARAGVLEPFANHAFQPRAVVRRTDLAQAVARLLARIAVRNPGQAKAWESARLKFPDLSTGHLAYRAASAAVAAGVMKTGPENGAFQPSRPVTGAEAIEAIAKLESLAGLSPATKTKNPR